MKYEHWTKIDDGAEGAWAADVWLSALKIINKHEGESIYDADAPIYQELEKEIPDLAWRSFEGKSFRPYFRDFSKPWSISGVVTFDTYFQVTELGRELLAGRITEIDFWVMFLSNYQEGSEFPFVELSHAFLSLDKSLSLNEVYWGIVKSFRKDNGDHLIFDDLASESIPSTVKRRLTLMLQLMERTGAILKIGHGAKQRWKKWDVRVLKKLTVRGADSPSPELTLCCLHKPFVLLAGISGTGKTRFVREQAKLTGSIDDTYCLTSVRPDWHEPSDLLGYTSRLSGNAEYIVTDVLKFIMKAWIAIKDAGITLQGKEVVGEKNQQRQVKPYWLCLDEMNLAPVEQYFADYLSVLETREWAWQGNDFTYQCDPLLKATVLEAVDKDKLKGELGLIDHDELWDHFVANGISIPFNLIVAGTVNMDETTHGFSRKVIDRALTFDFGEFFPNDFDTFFDATSEPKALSYPVLTDGRNKTELSSSFDKDGTLSVAFLKQINDILGNTPFKLAYRALNELLLAVITQNPNNEVELQSVWDDFLMCKVLPRIEGDIDKLTKGDSDNSILEQLSALLSEQLNEIWATKSRQDLFRKSLEDDPLITIECRSKVKLEWMSDQLKNGFTSFWP